MPFTRAAIAALFTVSCAVLSASATEPSEPAQVDVVWDDTALIYLEEAAGTLHHSCRSLVARYGDDEDAIFDVIEGMIAVSLYNRRIDFTALDLTDAEREEIHAEFLDELGDGCAVDADAMIAGIVDRVVARLVEFY